MSDQQEAPVIDYCLGCTGEIYKGQEVLKFGDGLVCDGDCLIKALDAHYTTAGDE
ncbi:hypothetical protein [Staphylococcus warneri]|uniref:hypothetical protein n=1 Tax=Staphylococcus warneri TaxID=1292 RepID=UPI003B9F6526